MKAQFFDGLTARAHDVEVEHVADQLVIRQAAAQIAVWPLADLRLIRPAADKGPVLGSSSSPEQRLAFDDEQIFAAPGDLADRLSPRDTSCQAIKSRCRLFAAGAAALGLLIALFVAAPWLAGPISGLIPLSLSAAIGKQLTEALEGDLGRRCRDRQGEKILAGLTARLSAGGAGSAPIHISVLASDQSNALTAPGGYIVVFKGLIEAAESPEELAGVIAHELAHAALRHPEEALVRHAGLGLLMASLAQSGGLSALPVNLGARLMITAYSRDDEWAADDLALRLLRRAGISSDGFAGFFARLEARQGAAENAFEYLSTHPPSGQRRIAIERHGAEGSDGEIFKPALTATEWRALKLICAGD